MRVAFVALVACTPHHAESPAKTPEAGISIALYDKGGVAGSSYGVVDDRRWIDITGKELVLDHIDPGAALASLAIESLGDRVTIDRCARARIPDPPPSTLPTTTIAITPQQQALDAEIARRRILLQRRYHQAPPPPPPAPTTPIDRFDTSVRCTVEGAPGRHLIRILYVSTTLAFRGEHDVVMTAPDHATVTSRFAFQTPAWRTPAEVAVFDGVPGGERPPRELARGPVALDGSVAVIAVPAQDVKARLRRVYDGAIATPELPAADAAWNQQSLRAVWVWLELDGLHLAPGPLRVHVELPAEGVRDIDVPAQGRRQADRSDAPLRLPLWPDEQLAGSRQRFADTGDAQLAERLLLSVANLGDVAREVWIEEHVRSARARKVEHAWPAGVHLAATPDQLVRVRVDVKPHAVERLGYTIEYEF